MIELFYKQLGAAREKCHPCCCQPEGNKENQKEKHYQDRTLRRMGCAFSGPQKAQFVAYLLIFALQRLLRQPRQAPASHLRFSSLLIDGVSALPDQTRIIELLQVREESSPAEGGAWPPRAD